VLCCLHSLSEIQCCFPQGDEIGRNSDVPLFNAQAFDNSTSNSLRQSVESNVGAAESGSTAHIIRLVERLRDLQRIVLPTQVVEAPDGQVFFFKMHNLQKSHTLFQA
jgi:hypothetical protein